MRLFDVPRKHQPPFRLSRLPQRTSATLAHLAQIMSQSSWVAAYLSKYPILLDELISATAFGYRVRTGKPSPPHFRRPQSLRRRHRSANGHPAPLPARPSLPPRRPRPRRTVDGRIPLRPTLRPCRHHTRRRRVVRVGGYAQKNTATRRNLPSSATANWAVKSSVIPPTSTWSIFMTTRIPIQATCTAASPAV